MTRARALRSCAAWCGAALVGAAATYAAMVAYNRARYGVVEAPRGDEADRLLDRFMPAYETVERHQSRVDAPAADALAAAYDVDLRDSTIARAIFRTRELVLGAKSTPAVGRQPLRAQVEELGWGVLAEIPGREIVFGAVTQPWMANVHFRPLPADEFVTFKEPGYVKIAWTLRADPVGPQSSIVRTETRVVATDPQARDAFRRYWSYVVPGVRVIRLLLMRLVKTAAERRAAA
jgi:hypothetical protein